jgi:hypothetical protein
MTAGQHETPAEVPGASSAERAATGSAAQARAGISPPARAARPGSIAAEVLGRALWPGQVRVLDDYDFGDPRRS